MALGKTALIRGNNENQKKDSAGTHRRVIPYHTGQRKTVLVHRGARELNCRSSSAHRGVSPSASLDHRTESLGPVHRTAG